ncbi:MAG: glycosyltransferase family 39 protein [Planctomycetes bacterium]|nr:glycosyltransferase family 39 protein [Planctomycetota bacterium]
MTVGSDFVKANGSYSLWLFTMARWACIPFSLLGGYICFRWASNLYGGASGLLATALWCFSPFILGHASLITPDAHAAAIGVAAGYVFWLWLCEPSWSRALGAGIVLGLAELAKFTLVIVYPLWLIIWIGLRMAERSHTGVKRLLREIGQLALIMLISLYMINLWYGLEGSFQRLADFRFQTRWLTGLPSLEEIPHGGANRFIASGVGAVPMPLPRNYVQGIDAQKLDFEGRMWSYLRGEWRMGGWRHYYLYAVAIKVPLGTWLLVLLALVLTIFGRGYSASWRDEMVVLAPLLAILAFVSSQTGFSIHSRYVIPALPFLFIWTSKVARAFEMSPLTRRRVAMATMVGGALTWSVGSSLAVYPHSLSYFNESVGGPRRGPEHLLDSNIDWGQDLLHLNSWLNAHPRVQLDGLALHGLYPATLARIPETLRPPPGVRAEFVQRDSVGSEGRFGPKPGWYAVSVNCLYDRSRQYRHFLNFEPAAMAGYSIYIYHITPEEANRVRRQLGMAELPVETDAIEPARKADREKGRSASGTSVRGPD